MKIAENERGLRVVRILVAMVMLIAVVAALHLYRSSDLVNTIMRNEAQLKRWATENCLTACLTAMIVYALATSLPIPVASLGSLAVGWLFGFWQGLPVVSFGSTLGASITFLLARFVFHESIYKIRSRKLASFQEGFVRDGIYYITALRLVPGLPFFLVNSFLAQTRVSFSTFWTTSMMSMLPASAIYVSAGAALPSLSRMRDDGLRSVFSWQLGIALAVLAIQPVVFRLLVARYRREENTNV